MAQAEELKVNFKQAANVLLEDVNGQIKKSGKWPLVIDEVGQVVTFLKYRECNCINTLTKEDMEPERLRKALIGAIRFGKVLVLDMMDADMFKVCVDQFDEIQKGLIDSLLDFSILKDEKYLSLVKKVDGDEYSPNRPWMAEDFKLFIVTLLPSPPGTLVNRMFPVRVLANQ